MVVEFVVGLMINSLARQADAFHMASDVASMAIGWYASHVTGGAKTARATFGHRRHEIVGALINCVFLLSICFTIIIDALQRIPKYEEIAADLSSEVDLLLIVGGVGLGINILGLFVFTVGHGHSHGGGGGGHGHSHGGGGDHGHSHSGGGGGGGHGHSHGGGDHGHLAAASGLEPSVGPDDGGHGHHDHGDHAGHSHTSGDGHAHDDGDSHAHGVALPASHAEAAPEQRQRFSLNIQGVLLHVAGDALGSIAVIFSGLLVKYLSSPLRGLADPLCSLAIVFLLIGGTLSPLRRCLAIVTQGAPAHVDVPGLEARLRSVTHVLAVHDLHVWQLDEKRVVGSVHLVVSAQARNYYKLLDDAKSAFHQGGVHASTVQVEFVVGAAELQSCFDPLCGDTCESFHCCPPPDPAPLAASEVVVQ